MDPAHLIVLREHEFCCSRCERQVPEVTLYVIGEKGFETTMCSVCQPELMKSDFETPDEMVIYQLILREEQLHALVLHLKSRTDTSRIDVEYIDNYWKYMSNNEFVLSDGGKKSVRAFLGKVGVEEIVDAINIAFAKISQPDGRFAYMCGVLNSSIKERNRTSEATEISKYWNYRRPQIWKKAEDGKVEYIAQKYNVTQVKYYIDCVVDEYKGWADFDRVIEALTQKLYG